MKPINYQAILDNARHIVNALEFDCMRSGGKTKFNAPTLNELYTLIERVEKMLDAEKPAPVKVTTPTEKKEK